MRTLLFTLLFALISYRAMAQDTTARGSDKYFVVLYTIGSSWDTTRQFSQQPYFKEHSAHLAALRKSGRIAIGARYSDTGMVLLKAKDQSEAEGLVRQDEAIRNNLFKAAVFPFSPFFKGCVE